MKIKKFLKKLKIKKLRPKQKDAVNSLLLNNDTILVAPTSYGKSLVFNLYHFLVDNFF